MTEPPANRRLHTTPSALQHLAAVLLTLGILVSLTYLPFEVLAPLRPWHEDDGTPVARLFDDKRESLPAFAEAGGAYVAASNADKDQLQEDLGSAVAGNLELKIIEDPKTPEVPSAPMPRITIGAEEYDDIPVFVENPGALRDFYTALARTARREGSAMTRVGHYGDSSIATDHLTGAIRRNFQLRFGDGGHGFVLPARGTMPYIHRDIRLGYNKKWSSRKIVSAQDSNGLYGYGGVSFRPTGAAVAFYGTDDRGLVGREVSSFEIFFRRHPTGGLIRVNIDDDKPQFVSTKGVGDDFVKFEVPQGPHRMTIRPGSAGGFTVYGVVLETDGPGLVYDSMGLVGARARRLLNYDPAHIAAQIAHRDLDLLVLGFGGNEADDPMRRLPRYEGEFVEVIRRMRAGKEDMSCLIFAPLDQGQRAKHGGIRTIPSVPHLVDAQKRAALAEGCAFYNTFAAMGGEGSMLRWYRARPRLALPDFRHATPAGYEVIGNMFYKALLKGFAQFLAENPDHATLPRTPN